MKRFRSQTGCESGALYLLKGIGAAVSYPMVVIGGDGTILFANEGFIEFAVGLGRGSLIKQANQVEDLFPERPLLDRIWKTGDPMCMPIYLPLAAGITRFECHGVPFINERQRVSMVTLVYRTIAGSVGLRQDTMEAVLRLESSQDALWQSYREFEESLDQFAHGNPVKTRPLHPDDPLIHLKRKYNEGIDHVRKMLSVAGLFGTVKTDLPSDPTDRND